MKYVVDIAPPNPRSAWKPTCSGKARGQSGGQVQEKLAETKSTVVLREALTDFNLVNFCGSGADVQTLGEQFVFYIGQSRGTL